MGNCPMPCPQFDEPDPDPPVSPSHTMTEMHILSTPPPPSFYIVQVSPPPDHHVPEATAPQSPVFLEKPAQPVEPEPQLPPPEKHEDDTESVDSWDESTTVEVSHDEARLQGDILHPDE
jgi:hypothetical protein